MFPLDRTAMVAPFQLQIVKKIINPILIVLLCKNHFFLQVLENLRIMQNFNVFIRNAYKKFGALFKAELKDTRKG